MSHVQCTHRPKLCFRGVSSAADGAWRVDVWMSGCLDGCQDGYCSRNQDAVCNPLETLNSGQPTSHALPLSRLPAPKAFLVPLVLLWWLTDLINDIPFGSTINDPALGPPLLPHLASCINRFSLLLDPSLNYLIIRHCPCLPALSVHFHFHL